MQTNIMQTKKKKRAGKVIKWIIIIVILYVAAGALVPFMFHPKVKADAQKELDISRFYGQDSPGIDRAVVVETSQEALDARILMINEAKETIALSTFDIRPGGSCDDIFAALLDAADRGVKVKVLVDGLYGMIHMKKLPMFYAAGSHPNLEIRFYNKPNLLMPWTINGRLHDKLILVDDKLLMAGGRNTFDYFLGNYTDKNLSYDRDVLVYNTKSGSEEGTDSVVAQALAYYDGVWNLGVCKTEYDRVPGRRADEVKAEEERLCSHYQELQKNRPELFAGPLDYESFTLPTDKITLIHNPTHIYSKQPYVWYQLQQLMLQAKERAYVQTPYVAFSKDMYAGMIEVGERLERFDMQINNPAVGDNLMAGSDYLFQKKKVIKTGVQIYEFQGDHSSHGKSMLIDEDISLIGSYNLDMRSTYIDTETMLVIDGEEFQDQLEAKIMAMHAQSLAVNPDGTYAPDPDVPVAQAPKKKAAMFRITPYLFQLIRYLI